MGIESYLEHTPVVDPTAFVHESAVLIGEIEVGAESSIWPNTTLRGDDGAIVIGARTSIQDGSVIHATEDMSSTRIGDQVTIGHRAIIHGATIGSNTIVGMGSIVLDNAEIGENCLIGAGSLVTSRVKIPAGSLVLGSPAKVVRPLTQKELEWVEYSWKRYVEQSRIYRAKA